MYGVQTTGKPVKIISKIDAKKAGPLLRNSNRHEEQQAANSQRPRRRGRHSARRKRADEYIAKHGIEWVTFTTAIKKSPRHARDDRTGRRSSNAAAAAWKNIWSKRRSRIRTLRCTTSIRTDRCARISIRAHAINCRRSRKKSSRTRTASSLGRLITMMKDVHGSTISQFLTQQLFASQPERRPQDLRNGQDSARGPTWCASAGTKPIALSGDPADENFLARDRLHFADRRRIAAQGFAPVWCPASFTRRQRGRRRCIAAIRF